MSESPLVDLMARVGFLLLRWGVIEHAVRESGGAFKTPDIWQSTPELRTARDLRNLIAHGIIRASADPATGLEAHIVCASENGEERRITLSDLEAAIRVLEREGARFIRPGKKRPTA